MKCTILTNFEDYIPKISSTKNGIIILKLIPNRVDEVLYKDSFIKKKCATLFSRKYCTIYKKKNNEYLFKYTNYKPNNNFNYEVVDILEHNIPYNFDREYTSPSIKSIYATFKKNYYQRKYKYYSDKYLGTNRNYYYSKYYY